MKRGKIHGVGINDVDYNVVVSKTINGKSEHVWMCPYYKRWKDMIKRCYSKAFHKSRPTYKDVNVCEEWKTFSNFRAWMENQDWEGKQLDKDIFGNGKIYSPESCIFITLSLNVFVEWTTSSRDLPRGVSWCKKKGKYRSYGRENGKTKYLGQSDNISECEMMWKTHKISLIDAMIAETKDINEIKALNKYRSTLTS